MRAKDLADNMHFFDLESPSDLARLTNPKLDLDELSLRWCRDGVCRIYVVLAAHTLVRLAYAVQLNLTTLGDASKVLFVVRRIIR